MTTPTAEVIDRFDGPYRFLSNFWPCEITYMGEIYRTLEHAYQAGKCLDESWRIRVRVQPTPAAAKRFGRHLPLRKDWDAVKLGIMENLVRQKFSKGFLRQQLLDTGDKTLIEGNDWGDKFWGMYNGQGHNHLGKILMKVREELRQ